MRLSRTTKSKIDALDLAVIWPCSAQLAGLSLPPIEAIGISQHLRRDEVDGHGIW